MHIILASASPRRRELIHQIGWTEEICPSSFSEAATPKEARARLGEFPEDVCLEISRVEDAGLVTLFNAYGKGKRICEEKDDEVPIVAADTVVTLDGDILGKPRDTNDARAMLRLLSGREHAVKTGLAVFHKDCVHLHVETTRVYFRKLSDLEIDRYVATGEPMDKAGAYGIQGVGGRMLVHDISGDFYNVVGLPIARVARAIQKLS